MKVRILVADPLHPAALEILRKEKSFETVVPDGPLSPVALIEKMKEDDLELLKFGYKWLRFTLFGEKTMTIKDEVVKKKMSELEKSKAKDKG